MLSERQSRERHCITFAHTRHVAIPGPCDNPEADCAALRREECTQEQRSVCGACVPGYTATQSGPGNDKCELDCSGATDDACFGLNREACGSDLPNTCGGCLPSYRQPSVPGWQDTNEYACTVSCSGVDKQLCNTVLNREACADTPETCGSCLPGFNSTVQGDSNVRCLPFCGDVDCAALNRADCTSQPNVCGPCLPRYTDETNTTANSVCTLSLTTCNLQPDDECISANRLPCSTGIVPNTCGDCKEGYTDVDGLCSPDCSLVSDLQCDVIFHRQPCTNQVSSIDRLRHDDDATRVVSYHAMPHHPLTVLNYACVHARLHDALLHNRSTTPGPTPVALAAATKGLPPLRNWALYLQTLEACLSASTIAAALRSSSARTCSASHAACPAMIPTRAGLLYQASS